MHDFILYKKCLKICFKHSESMKKDRFNGLKTGAGDWT